MITNEEGGFIKTAFLILILSIHKLDVRVLDDYNFFIKGSIKLNRYKVDLGF